MERSYKKIGHILRWIAKNHDGKSGVHIGSTFTSGTDEPSIIEGLTNGEVDYLVSLMDEGGLITRWSDFTIKSITWKGYDLLSEFERWQS